MNPISFLNIEIKKLRTDLEFLLKSSISTTMTDEELFKNKLECNRLYFLISYKEDLIVKGMQLLEEFIKNDKDSISVDNRCCDMCAKQKDIIFTIHPVSKDKFIYTCLDCYTKLKMNKDPGLDSNRFNTIIS